MTGPGSSAGRILRIVAGTGFHLAFCLFASFVLTVAITLIITAISFGEARNTELVLGSTASALAAAFAAPRWFRGSAPWVSVFGLLALFAGGQELYLGWSPTWSHQTRTDYVLSQLFGLRPGCGASECLYMLFFGYPFVCLTTYAVVGAVALALTKKKAST
ncbi:MAG TPA: hypothetical protein VGM18_10850 [Candidatus Sulfotelmatobacter sp.]|jgi:hypothetical protein